MGWNAGLVRVVDGEAEIFPMKERCEYFELPESAADAEVVAHARGLFGLLGTYGSTHTDLDSLVFTPHGADYQLYVCPA